MSSQSVSVILPVFNAALTIERAMQSALAQDEVSEVIVVDDASADESAQIVEHIAAQDHRLKLLRQPHNQGAGAARNLALAHSTAEWIALLDADDFFEEGRIRTLLSYADDADLIADDLYKVDLADIDGPRETLFTDRFELPCQITLEQFLEANMPKKSEPQRSDLSFIKPLMRRSFLQEKALKYEETVRLGEDYAFYVRALANGARMVLTPAAGYVYTMSSHSLSAQHPVEDLYRLREVDRDFLKTDVFSARERNLLRQHARYIDCRYQWVKFVQSLRALQFIQVVSCLIRPLPVPVFILQNLFQVSYKRLLKKRSFS